MEAKLGLIVTSILVVAFITFVVKLLNLVWFRPRKLEKFLRKQGLNGNSYRLLVGDLKDFTRVRDEERLRSLQLSDDILPHIFSYYLPMISKYGKNCFIWFGPWPTLTVVDLELIKEILRKPNFHKPFPEKNKIIIGGGLGFQEDEKWAKHRKIINPAFYMEKLKNMVPAMGLSCSNMIENWKTMVVSGSNQGGFCEIDVWPYLQSLTGDVISRTAFGSSYEESRTIFQLQQQRVELTLKIIQLLFIPGWRYLPTKSPTKSNKKVKAISDEMDIILRSIVEKRQQEVEREEATNNDDLLGILFESNSKFIEEHGSKNSGLSIEEVIEECKLFYVAGSETTSSLMVWTMILLCKHPEWQTKARKEVIRFFGHYAPTYQGLNHLKCVTMILQEVLRLYPIDHTYDSSIGLLNYS